MKQQAFKLTSMILFPSIVCFSLIYNQLVGTMYVYWLIPIWLLTLFSLFKVSELTPRKILLMLHVVVLLCGLFSFITYQLFLRLSDLTRFTSPDFTNVSNLMFHSETALYLTIYAGLPLFVADSFCVVRYIRKVFEKH
jgi:hypothetical protein